MKTNLDTIQEVVEYIEAHLEERLDLDSLCKAAGYSKYHLGHMFSDIVGFKSLFRLRFTFSLALYQEQLNILTTKYLQ